MMLGRAVAGRIACTPAPGIAKVMSKGPVFRGLLTRVIALRSEPTPRSAVLVTTRLFASTIVTVAVAGRPICAPSEGAERATKNLFVPASRSGSRIGTWNVLETSPGANVRVPEVAA